ncbi:hypothetical protein [Streptomyces brasiliensis]
MKNPALYSLMYSEPTRVMSAAFRAGMEILMGRIHRLAAGGRLRVDEDLAAVIIHATARGGGAVLTWLSLPEDCRNPALLTTLRESIVASVTNQSLRCGRPARPARPAPPAPCAPRCPSRRVSAARNITCCAMGWTV